MTREAEAFDDYVQSHWGGWTKYAKLHTQSSAGADKGAFLIGHRAGLAETTRLRADLARVEGEKAACPNCDCADCRTVRNTRNNARTFEKDANSRCWSCSGGWTGCYTRADIRKYGEPSECGWCYRERLIECEPPALAQSNERAGEGKCLSHDAAIQAMCDCAATVTVLSYQEAIEGYLKLRGIRW